MWPRPLTRIHQIELTSECNLACRYCPHPKMLRPKEHMSMQIFERALQWVIYFSEYGENQTELSLTGLGEPLLHPDFLALVKLTRQVFKGRLLFATNGLLLRKEEHLELCHELAALDVEVFISTHRPEIAGLAVQNCLRAGMKVGTNTAFVDSSLNWAGQVDWPVTAQPSPCRYLEDGWGVVLQSGYITTCCMDAEGDGVVAHVDDIVGRASVRPYSLCSACSLIVPEIEEKRRA